MPSTTTSWQDIHQAKKRQQLASIPPEWLLHTKVDVDKAQDLRSVVAQSGLLSPEELDITEAYDATGLVEAMAAGQLRAETVVTAYCKRAAIGHQLCNNLTEIMFHDAIAYAKQLDEHFARTGRIVGPLHGVPMTFKECFHFAGYDSTNGYISRAFQPVTYNTPLVEVMRAAGACILSKTNVPQTMMVAESDNNLYGPTRNPVKPLLTCGGSSGGEGSAVAFRSSAIGIGTDVGGSIRIPAGVNGNYGFKPSYGLLAFINYSTSNWPGTNVGIPAVFGPIAHSVRDMELVTRVVRQADPWTFDPAVIPYVYEIQVATRRPVVGLIKQSGLTPQPPVARAIALVRSKLEASGFDVRDFVPPSFATAKQITLGLFTADGFSYPRQEMEKAGEPPVPSVLQIGFWQHKAKTPEQIWALGARKAEYQKQMLDTWQNAGVDVVICPLGAYAAARPGGWTNDMYTAVWNMCDRPVVVVPVTKVDAQVDKKYAEFEPLSEVDAAIQAQYDPELYADAPVAVQVVGSRLMDRQLLHDVEQIDQALRE